MTAFAIAIVKACQHCGHGFIATKRSQKWCGNACKVAAYKRRREASR